MHAATRMRALLVTGSTILAMLGGSTQAALAEEGVGTWPSVESCEPWVRTKIQSPDDASGERSTALIETLRDPGFSAVLAFRSRNGREGAIVADGQHLDVDVPTVVMDVVGNALVDGSDHLAFMAMADGPWSSAEMRSGGHLRARMPTAELSWRDEADEGGAGLRLPDVLASATAATPVAAPAGQDGHWYKLRTAVDLGPGIMWDSTRNVFPVLRDAAAALWIEAAEDGTPLAACLKQSWWQGMDDVLGEDAWMLSAIRFDRVSSAPSLPSWPSPSEHERVAGLDLEIQTPPGWQSSWDADDGRYWLWRDDEDTLPSLSIHRVLVPDRFLVPLRELPVEQMLDALASTASTDARRAWNRDPETTEFAWMGGADGEVAVPARLLTYRPDFDDIGPGFAIDVVAFVDPWAYAIQLVTASGDEFADRYVFERILEGVRFLCSNDGVDDCPAVAE